MFEKLEKQNQNFPCFKKEEKTIPTPDKFCSRRNCL